MYRGRKVLHMLISGLAKMKMMSKVNSGSAVKMGETNVYAILGSTKKGPAEFAKMAVVKEEITDTSIPMRKVVSMPEDNYFLGYMDYDQAGKNFAELFADFSQDRFNEIMEYLEFEKGKKIEEMSSVALQKMKIAVTLSRNSRVYMLDNPFSGMNATAREQMMRVIFSWAIAANTIAIQCHNVDEIEQMIAYAVEHEGDLPVISVAMGKAMNESFA